jgi:hypothetical protein
VLTTEGIQIEIEEIRRRIMKKILVVTILALTTSVIVCGPRVVRANTVERSYSSSSSVEAPPPAPVVQERSSTTVVEKKSSATEVIQ